MQAGLRSERDLSHPLPVTIDPRYPKIDRLKIGGAIL
jgi:hypothetical protein